MKSLSARSSLSLTARTAAQHQRNQPLDFHCQPRVAGPAGRQRLDYRLTGTFHCVVENEKNNWHNDNKIFRHSEYGNL
jgi:hypothetical protein